MSFFRFVIFTRQPEARQHEADDAQQHPEDQTDLRAQEIDTEPEQ